MSLSLAPFALFALLQTLTQGSGFTIGTQFQFAGPPDTIGTEYQAVNSTSALNCQATWDGGGNKDWWGLCVTYKAAASATKTCTLALLGAGPCH